MVEINKSMHEELEDINKEIKKNGKLIGYIHGVKITEEMDIEDLSILKAKKEQLEKDIKRFENHKCDLKHSQHNCCRLKKEILGERK